MKIGVAAASTPRWPKIDWLCEAIGNLGHEVQRCTDQQGLPQLLRDCGVVFMGQKNLACHWPHLPPRGPDRPCPIVYWWFDLVATQSGERLEHQPLFCTFRKWFQSADVVLVKERSLLREYGRAGVNAHWCDQGCPSHLPEVDRPAEREFDLLLWGQGGGHYRERQRAVQAAVEAGFRVGWAATQPVPAGCTPLPWTPPMELPALASRARCVLSAGRRNDIDGYWSDSFWLAVGMGACVIRRATPGIPEGPYWTYEDTDRLIEHLRWAKTNPRAADETGELSRQWVMENHTIEHSVQDALRIVAATATAPDTSG